MKRFQAIKQAATVFSLVLFASGSAWAHSMHDHTTLPLKWEFSKTIQSKIDRNLTGSQALGSIGLTKFEQRKMDHYGIKVNNRIKAHFKGHILDVERTTMGIRIAGVTDMSQIAATETIPLRLLTHARPTMENTGNHAGHDHSRLAVEWAFGDSSNAKIVKRLRTSSKTAFVGLNEFEQTLLNEYGIHIGNTFQARIMDMPFTVKRTSGGVVVYKNVEPRVVAERPVSSGNPDRF